jgi:hypothetical protein
MENAMYTRIGDKGYWIRKERLFANLSLVLCGFLIGVVFSAFVFSGVIAGVAASLAAFLFSLVMVPIDWIRKDQREFAEDENRARIVGAEAIDEKTVCVYIHNHDGEISMLNCSRPRKGMEVNK